jgi:5'-nucleotidase
VAWILLTNDDGIDAPGLPALARAIAGVAPVRVVVPDRERSWIGKAITRFDPLHVEEVERSGIPMYSVAGFPADCVQLGVHAMFDDAPDLVVSGVNIGFNHGTAYLLSSGTVGAALEASITGTDALAFSTGSSRPWREWRPWIESPAGLPEWERVAAVAAAITADVWAARPIRATLSVNIPEGADTTTERRITTLAEVGYDRLFTMMNDGTYVHDYRGGITEYGSMEGTDIRAAEEGVVSITPVGGAHTGRIDDAVREALNGTGG